MTAALGIACGLGAYVPIAISLVLMLALLSFGGVLDRAVFGRSKRGKIDPTDSAG